jgi:hypothetical protein
MTAKQNGVPQKDFDNQRSHLKADGCTFEVVGSCTFEGKSMTICPAVIYFVSSSIQWVPTKCLMNGLMGGWMGGWTDGRMDGWKGGWMDGWVIG